MKKKMYWSLCVTSILVVVVTAALTLWSVYGLLLRQAESDLAGEHKLIARSISYAGPDAVDYLGTLDIRYDSFRITMVSRDGAVLFDSDNDLSGMENHLDRPEVREAFERGSGTDVRRSETMGLDTVYYAARLDPDTVLRVSRQTRSVGAVFASIVPLMAVILLLVVLASMAVASSLTRRMLRPIERLAENIDDTDGLEGYEELEPFFVRIRDQNHLIREQMVRLRDERDTISTITSNMQEGLILLDMERNVLSVNRSALRLLDAADADYEGKSVLNVSRDPDLTACVERALGGESGDVVISRREEFCHAFASPVLSGRRVCGVILLLLDVTAQQKAEKIRRDFTANVSHELKTPLTSISGFAELIEGGMVGRPEDVKRFAGRIYREASRLIALTDDIIRLSRIEEGGEVDLEPVALLSVCRGVEETLRFPAEQKQVALAVGGEDLSIRANPRMMEELCYNLMDNAVKYNRPGGRVDVSVRRDGERAVLTVADTGIGISKEHQERIFERFYRVDRSRSKQTGGTGLGLSIVKHIVERHGGTVTLESAPETGTAVTVRLPLDQ